MDTICPPPEWHIARWHKAQDLLVATYGPRLLHRHVIPVHLFGKGGGPIDLILAEVKIEPHVWQSRWSEPPHTRFRASTFCDCINVLIDVWFDEATTAVLRDNLEEAVARNREIGPIAA